MTTDDIVNQFANTLQKRNARPSILYGEKKSDSSIYKEVKVRDVITIISKQLNAIKNADNVGKAVRRKKPLYNKHLDGVPVNFTTMEIQSNTENKFETQCILDTQLMNLIENAEAIQKDIKKTNALCQKLENSDLEIKDVARKCTKNADNTSTIDFENIDIKTFKNNSFSEENHLNNVFNTHDNKNKSFEDSEDHENREINDCINDNDDFNDSIFNEFEIPSSPILRIVKTISKPPPLIYTLEEFDKFESLAAPVLNEIADYEDAKRIITSQLKDLFVNTHSEIVTTDKEIEFSNISKFINNKQKTQYSFDINSGVIGDVVEDEMLFDSDDDIKYSDDLPLTCYLETSLCNNTEVLDKTMYVGFQTASNQSIQILSDSFKKAKTVFDNVSKTVAENLSITELVEAVDRKKHKVDDVVKENDVNDVIKENDGDDVIKEKIGNDVLKENDGYDVIKENDGDDIIKENDRNDNEIMKKGELTAVDVYNSKESTIDYKNITKNDNNHITEHIDEHIMREFENNLMPFEDNVSIETSNERKAVCTHSSNGIDNIKNYAETDILTKISIDNNNLKRSGNHNLIGFKTASNKKIKISDQALSKTKNIFDDIDLNDSEKYFNNDPSEIPKESNNDFVGFKTANNKNIKKSPEALLKTKIIFDNIDNEISFNQNVEHKLQSNEQRRIKTEPVINGFINSISVQNMKKSASFPLKEIDLDEASSMRKSYNDTNGIKDKVANQFQGFRTASNKTVIISDNMLEKSKKIFQDIEEDQNTRELEGIKNEMYPVKSVTCLSFKGFKTANNKPIKISDEALVKTKTVFQDIENGNTISDDRYIKESSKLQGLKTEPISKSKCLFEDINYKDYKKNVAPNQKQPVPNHPNLKSFCVTEEITTDKFVKKTCFAGFQTASNKNVKISEDALIKSRKIFEDFDLNNKKKDEENPKLKGFCTASNKIVKISEDALVKSRKIFEDIDLNNKKKDEENPKLKGFCTASNKIVKISEDALVKSRKIFEDIDLNNKKKDEENPKLKGFFTASNKNVKISEDALIKSRKIFEDIDLNNKKKDEEGQKFKGFFTASNKNVKISEDALLKSRKIFQDIDLSKENKHSYADSSFKGFCTASNRKVIISEDALVESRNIFENLCDKNEYCEEEHKKNIKAKLKNNVSSNSDVIKKPGIHRSKEIIIHEENKITESVIHVEDFLNTEMVRIFDQSLNTEDFFKDNTPICKRSGSPILSCSKTKKKKFEAPKSTYKIMQRDIKIPKPVNPLKFDENYKKIKKYTLSDILVEKSVNFSENIDPYILNFKFDTLLEFRFENKRNDIDSDSWTTEKIKKYFTDFVNKKNIPEGWIDNHMKLIIWKLISYEMFSPKLMKYACSIKNVLQQLKYRYDRELYNVERPALRKILEKDDVSTKSMILCVASLYVDGVSVNSFTNQIKNIELLLTDGWYCVKAKADGMFDKLIIDGKISIGTKLAIHGAELTNCEQGISPWEDTSAVRLKISGNSTKRAKWDARLGFLGNGAMMSRLTAVKLEGGKISRLRVFVTRVYPTMYVEKFEDGSTVTRSERLEHLHQMKCETERQIQMEKLYEDVVKMSEQESDDSEEQYTEQGNLDTGSQISRLMKKSKDPLEFKATLTSSQAYMLNNYTDRQNEILIQKIQNKAQVLIKKRGLDVARNVVPLMKVRVYDERKAMITIWRPNESLLDLIKEGAWIDVYNVMPTSIRYSEIQISAGRQSMFCKSKLNETDRLRTLTQTLRRKCYTIKDLQSSQTTDYNEIDTCGLVFLIEPKDYAGSKELFQNVYISGVDKSIVSVNFWGGVKKFGFENILEVGQLVACVNLQKRAGNTRNIPQYRATEYTYFTKTPKFESAKKLLDELSAQLLKIDKTKIVQDCSDLRNNYLKLKYSNTENVSPYRMNNSEYNISRNKMFIESPLINKDINNLDSNFKESRELSPNSLIRKKKVNEKIAKLKIYGEPPPLNHIHIINKSSKAIRPYKSPLISNDTSSAANTNFKNINNVTSGTLSVNKISSPVLNRTFIKINPVKLNFAFEENNFAEDLDSPPLSLDLSK